MARRYSYRDVLPFTAMVTVECVTVCLMTLFKAAALKGMSYYVFITYTSVISTLVFLPFLFIFRSASVLPSSKFPLISRICLLGLIGFSAQILAYKGIEYSSPTLASAMNNLSPACTFILAVIFSWWGGLTSIICLGTCLHDQNFFPRMEKVKYFRSSSTLAKIIGTIVSISGALVVVLYKGPQLFNSNSTRTPILSASGIPQWPQLQGSSQSNWAIGGLFLAIECILVSLWYIIQTQVMKIYPAEFAVVFLCVLCGTIISAPVCLMVESNLSSWVLRPRVAVAAVMFSGLLASPSMILGNTWALRLKGPVYVASFKPLSIPISVCMSALFLGEGLHLGSAIGSIILSIGFYAVIWGKAKEEEMNDNFTDAKAPLLESHKL